MSDLFWDTRNTPPDGATWIPAGGDYTGTGCLRAVGTDNVWCPVTVADFTDASLGQLGIDELFAGSGRGKGERGRTAKPDKPGKKAVKDQKTGRYTVKDPQTGKKILKPPGWSPDTVQKFQAAGEGLATGAVVGTATGLTWATMEEILLVAALAF